VATSLRIAVVLGVVTTAAVAALAAVDHHIYHVSLFSPESLPDRVQVCGRAFAAPTDPVVSTARSVVAELPDRPALVSVGSVRPWLHSTLTVLGRPSEPACCRAIYVGPDIDHLVAYGLLGGP
jgi:hypothetical protein